MIILPFFPRAVAKATIAREKRAGEERVPQRSCGTLTNDSKEILVGLMLGDLNARRQSKNTQLQFGQGLINKDYLEHLYGLFSVYCPQLPKIVNSLPDKRTGKLYSAIRFTTTTATLWYSYFFLWALQLT